MAILPFSTSQSLFEDLAVLGLEAVQPALCFQCDLELREVEIACVAQALEEEPVHDLGDALVAGTDTAVGGDVEDDRFGRDLLRDVLEQHLDLWISAALTEQFSGALAKDVAVGETKAEVLGEAGLTGTKEARDPDSDAFVGLLPGGLVVIEDLAEVAADGIGDDVFPQLIADDAARRPGRP